jgi:hypothetical protein
MSHGGIFHFGIKTGRSRAGPVTGLDGPDNEKFTVKQNFFNIHLILNFTVFWLFLRSIKLGGFKAMKMH